MGFGDSSGNHHASAAVELPDNISANRANLLPSPLSRLGTSSVLDVYSLYHELTIETDLQKDAFC